MNSNLTLREATVQDIQLERIIEEEDWGGELRLIEEQQEIDSALGTGRQQYGLLLVWWD